MLMTGAMRPGRACAEAMDECLLLAAILAQDLDALRAGFHDMKYYVF